MSAVTATWVAVVVTFSGNTPTGIDMRHTFYTKQACERFASAVVQAFPRAQFACVAKETSVNRDDK